MLPFIVFVFLGFMGTLIALSYMNLYKRVSATSVAVASNINKVCSIFIAWFVFRKSLSSMQIFGLVVSIVGIVLFFCDRQSKETGKGEKEGGGQS